MIHNMDSHCQHQALQSSYSFRLSMALEDVRLVILPQLPHGAQYVSDEYLPASALMAVGVSRKEAREFSPFSGLPLTGKAFEHQLRDASLPANVAHERVREVCSNAKIKIVVGETGYGKSI